MKFPRLIPVWPVSENPADTRKWVALIASFGGAVAFSFFAVWLVHIVWKGGWTTGTESQRIDIMGQALIIVLGGAISANLAFGFVLNRRSFKVGKDGIDISGGDDPTPPTPKIETTTITTATLAPSADKGELG